MDLQSKVNQAIHSTLAAAAIPTALEHHEKAVSAKNTNTLVGGLDTQNHLKQSEKERTKALKEQVKQSEQSTTNLTSGLDAESMEKELEKAQKDLATQKQSLASKKGKLATNLSTEYNAEKRIPAFESDKNYLPLLRIYNARHSATLAMQAQIDEREQSIAQLNDRIDTLKAIAGVKDNG